MITAWPAAARAWFQASAWRSNVALAVVAIAIARLLAAAAPQNFDTGWPEVAAGIGAFVMILLRRRWPLPLLVIAIAWGFAHVVVLERPTPMAIAILVLVFTACLGLDRLPAIGLGVVAAIALYMLGLLIADGYGDDRAIIGVAWTAGAVGIADATRTWRRYREASEAQLRSAVLASEEQTRREVAQERLDIARELHDLLAHNLSVMNVQTGAAAHLLRSDPDQAEVALAEARAAGRSVLDELRELLSVLRHDETDAPTAALPSFDRIGPLVDTMRSTGLDITWTESGAPRTLAPATSLAAYRVAQEALTNAAKHGNGAATLVTTWVDDGLTIRVANEPAGLGADTVAGGHGVVGMRERAALNGGHLDAGVIGGQFVVDLWLPAVAQHHSEAAR